MITILPKGDWILFKKVIIKLNEGLVLPDKVTDALCKNIVIAVGEKVTRARKGDEIMALPGSGVVVNFPERGLGNDIRMVREENVIAVIKEK